MVDIIFIKYIYFEMIVEDDRMNDKGDIGDDDSGGNSDICGVDGRNDSVVMIVVEIEKDLL